MGSVFGLLIELIVVVLLGFTVAYCVLLDRRLQRLRSDETAMRQTVVDLGLATERAEKAIEGLRSGIRDWEGVIGGRIMDAERVNMQLQETIHAGDEVLDRISRIVTGARKAMTEIESRQAPEVAQHVPPAPAHSTVAAAEAFLAVFQFTQEDDQNRR
jgi:cell division protein FtsX